MSCFGAGPLDIVIFLLDDMRFDQVDTLTETAARLSPTSVAFSRAYVTTPMCCPERASFLSGGWYAHQTGVRTNVTPDGGATQFDDARTLPVRLQETGYATALFGKYLNEYALLGAYVPPGWSDWGGAYEDTPWNKFDMQVGSSTPTAAGVATLEHYPGYIQDWETESATTFLAAHADVPIFLYMSYLAPHNPHVPADQDRDTFLDFAYRGRAYEEADVSDKPTWIREQALMTAAESADLDANNIERMQSLLAVDRSIAAIIDTFRATPGRENTVFILTSDNGQMWSEHRLHGKGVGYEESVRIPLIVAHPALTGGGRRGLVASNLDLAATVQEWAGLPIEGEGNSLIPTLCTETDVGRATVLLQAWPWDDPGWSGFVTETHKYLETETGEQELYDLLNDPFEETNIASLEPGWVQTLADQLAAERGLQITSRTLPEGVADQTYSYQLEHWGGVEPVVWSVVRDPWPEGLELGENGVVSGTPTRAGTAAVTVQAVDSGKSPYDGRSQRTTLQLAITITEGVPAAKAPPDMECGCGAVATGNSPVTGWLAAVAALVALVSRRNRSSAPTRT